MLVPMFLAFFLPDYSSVSQHMSELELLDHPIAIITRIAVVVSGVSIVVFALGAVLSAPQQFGFTALTALLAGAATISNGVFPMGNPLHGLYALALFMVLVPACFAAELGHSKKIVNVSLAAAVLTMFYFWLQFSGFDPHGFRGLTQRLAIIVMYGWFAVGGYGLLKHGTAVVDESR